MYNPVSTYRIQFQKAFSFNDFEKIISYLQTLGVQTVYASPVFESTSGSVHGYDVINPLNINPEIGTKEQLEKISKQLNENGIGWLQDIVPNHMAYHPNNKWLMDVFEKGEKSQYASFFDIIWNSNVYDGRVMAPFLGNTLDEVIDKGELKLTLKEQGIYLSYYDNNYPVHPNSYATVLHQKKRLSAEIKQAIKNISELKTIDEAKSYSETWNKIKSRLLNDEGIIKSLQSSLEAINNNKEALTQITKEQAYQLCYWQETDSQINFRRFFTINGLICLNIQDENVFTHYHELIRHFLEEGIFNGLRVDHIDGLFDPSKYLDSLNQLAGDETYIVVEKILEPGENLPHHWCIEGTTGYDFLALVNNIFTNKKNGTSFTKFYRQLTKDHKSIHQHLHDKKSDILFNYMEGELENLCHLHRELKLTDIRDQSSIHPDDLKNVIAEFLIQCTVYRYYGNCFPLPEPEASRIQDIFNRLRKSSSTDESAIAVLEKTFLHGHQNNENYNARATSFYQRCMQFTGPLMAKGIEDTLMYTFNRFIGHNEVGDSVESFGISVEEFHEAMIERQENWSLSLNATSTHDTKRGEDVRARLNVLTDIPDDWFNAVQQWQELTQNFKQNNFPDKNDEYFVYQSLVGNFPMPGENEDNFQERFIAYLQKALREAKEHSNWTNPNEEYENATTEFAKKLLNKNEPFRNSFEEFHSKIIDFGIVNSLSQLLLKFTCPGVPDVYQGSELWDLSFVDPDNRQSVDYEKRMQWLNEIVGKNMDEELWEQLWRDRYSGKVKLWLTHKLLQWRKEQKDFLHKAEYISLTVAGSYENHILAFARKYQQAIYIIAVPLHLAELCKTQGKKINEIDWKDTHIVLPGKLAGEIDNILTGKSIAEKISIKDIFHHLPVALLKTQLAEHKRGAGILLHITSLASPFGIGDMGHEAKLFAGFLYRSKQHYWQLLPINPTEAGQGHSPYSAISSKAGNPLLISPELLAKEKLLDSNEIKQFHLPQESQVNYANAEENKNILFNKAYDNFVSQNLGQLQNEFEAFCMKEIDWLDDFALYAALKKQNGGKPWYQWDQGYKQRAEEALQKFSDENNVEIRKTKWLQFIFFRQWKDLKEYCNNMNIQLIGDIPFYVSYDSADVWANKEIFALDEDGNRTGIAGVPPDAFSSDGQLWGMPVFKWDVLKERNYNWWIERLKKNIELFDIFRLDHFRAFDEYWEVPAGETTAKNGQWKSGPGKDFFEIVQKELKALPFIAEDLGEITQSVYHLRDAFHLPGMKVLQFAFGSDMPHSLHISHHYEQNFIVYTGTHDNNTLLGWYRTETNDETKKRIGDYLGKALNENEIHKELAQLAYASVGKIVILPMQDVLGLDENSRMNKPSSGENNWSWRLTPGQLSGDQERWLKEWTSIYDRQ